MEPGVGKESEAAAAAQGLMTMTVRKGANTSNDSSTSGDGNRHRNSSAGLLNRRGSGGLNTSAIHNRRDRGGRPTVTVTVEKFNREVAEKLKERADKLEMEKRILQLECDLTQARKKFGRNNTTKRTWNAGDVTNMVNLNSWLRMKLFRVYKFLPSTWSTYSPDKPLFMCTKVLTKVRLPPGVLQESYWETRLVPLINKKYVEMRSNINSACRLAYQGEFPTNMTCCIYTVASHPIFGFVCLFTNTGEEVLSQRPSAIGLSAGPLGFIEYDPDNPNYGEPIVNLCTFIAKYVMKIYGVKMINDWLKKNKGQRFSHNDVNV